MRHESSESQRSLICSSSTSLHHQRNNAILYLDACVVSDFAAHHHQRGRPPSLARVYETFLDIKQPLNKFEPIQLARCRAACIPAVVSCATAECLCTNT